MEDRAENDLIGGFWGKARAAGEEPAWHPLIGHLLDVAAVMQRLCQVRPAIVRSIALELDWPIELTRQALPALAALHDLGKFSPIFQAKLPERWPAALGPLPAGLGDRPAHGAAGMLLFDAIRSRRDLPMFADWHPKAVRALLAPVFGHHGAPVEPPVGFLPSQVFGAADRAVVAAMAWLDQVVELFGLDAAWPAPALAQVRRASWRLAGLMVLADWLGSARQWFPYAGPIACGRAYWQAHALPQAERAVTAAGITPAGSAPALGHAGLIGARFPPTAAQRWAETVVLPDGPLLVVLEDLTGSGKTEAALILAQRLLAAGRAHGLVMALPTQATANAMFARLGALYRLLFRPDATPSLALAHGASRLHAGFQAALRLPGQAPGEGDESSAVCNAWLGSESRKAFLADVGVTTIDQAVLAILPARFQALRLLGLAERVLIVDEAHAYDAYVGQELVELVRWQRALGGHVIILSATLPTAKRAELIEAFGGTAVEPGGSAAYPLVTMTGMTGTSALALAPRPDLVRAIAVERAGSCDAVIDRIVAAAEAGAAVCWFRNAVDDVLEAAAILSARGIEPILFHARFAMGDRLVIERQVLATFGRSSGPTERGRVLVASQVAEMSLDLDFDLVASDLAPIDSLLQRLGRAWRHLRPSRPIDGPRLIVWAPEPVAEPGRDWLGPDLRRTGRVYADHGVLWRTARALFQHPRLEIPADVPALIAAVYDDPAVPAGLEGSARRAEGEGRAQGSLAAANTLRFDQGYTFGNGVWDSDVRIPTRDVADTVTFRLAQVVDGVVTPWCADPDPAHGWARSEIRLRRYRAAAEAPAQGVDAAVIETAKRQWPEFEREVPLLVLHGTADGGWSGTVLDKAGRCITVRYDLRTGLHFAAAQA